MDKESIYERQKIDTNCNDCKHMERNIDKFKSFSTLQDDWDVMFHKWAQERMRLKASAELNKGDVDGFKRFLKLADNLKFSPTPKSRINYGTCTKKQIEVTFLPNQCVPKNQECFTHRKD